MCHFYGAKAAVNTSEPKAAVVTGTADWDRRGNPVLTQTGSLGWLFSCCHRGAQLLVLLATARYHNVVVSMSPLKSANQTACEQYFQPFDFKWKHS